MEITNCPFSVPENYKDFGPQPYIPIRIINPKTNQAIINWGLVDTGAFSCRLPSMCGESIGIDILKGRLCEGATAGGKNKVYVHPCNIEILDMDNNVLTRITGEFAFGDSVPFVLLGVQDFLKDYIVTIDYPRQVFLISKGK